MTSELDKFVAAQIAARKRGWEVRKADDPTDLRRYTLSHDGLETHYVTIDEVIAKIERVKP